MIDLEEIKRRINPAYADVVGTESYERKRLVEEIERLHTVNEDLRALLTKDFGSGWEDWDAASLRACERENAALRESFGQCQLQHELTIKELAAVREALKNHGEEAAKMVNAEPVAWMTEDGSVATDETKQTAMPRVARDSFNIPLYRRTQA